MDAIRSAKGDCRQPYHGSCSDALFCAKDPSSIGVELKDVEEEFASSRYRWHLNSNRPLFASDANQSQTHGINPPLADDRAECMLDGVESMTVSMGCCELVDRTGRDSSGSSIVPTTYSRDSSLDSASESESDSNSELSQSSILSSSVRRFLDEGSFHPKSGEYRGVSCTYRAPFSTRFTPVKIKRTNSARHRPRSPTRADVLSPKPTVLDRPSCPSRPSCPHPLTIETQKPAPPGYSTLPRKRNLGNLIQHSLSFTRCRLNSHAKRLGESEARRPGLTAMEGALKALRSSNVRFNGSKSMLWVMHSSRLSEMLELMANKKLKLGQEIAV